MKKLLLTLATSCILGAIASAGPEPYSGKEMKQVAPMPPPCPSWTGFYVGGFGAYTYGVIDPTLKLDGFWDAFAPPGDSANLESFGSNDLSASGAELGGLIGYNYQWNKWVFGAEASGGYLWLRNSDHGDTLGQQRPIDPLVISTSFKSHYLATFGPRIGYAFCRWLPYVTGGLALGDLDLEQHIRSVQGQGTFREGGSTSGTNVGWMVGGGLEYAITNHWRARGQYQYIDLGTADFNSAGTGFQSAPGYTGNDEVSLHEHNVSLAIIYGF